MRLKDGLVCGVGSGSHAEQTARVMIEFEKVLLREKPDLVIVVGDVNSTIACSLVASKLQIKTAHVEAGLRSFDRTMPEEINRLLTDSIADFLFVTEQSGLENLKHEGVPDEKVFLTGNVMIDSLVTFMPKAGKSCILEDYKLEKNNFILVTLHRPSNVDDKEGLARLIHLLNTLAEKRKLIFPIHPRQREKYVYVICGNLPDFPEKTNHRGHRGNGGRGRKTENGNQKPPFHPAASDL